MANFLGRIHKAVGATLLGAALSYGTNAAELTGPVVTRLPAAVACAVDDALQTAFDNRACDRLALDDVQTRAVVDESKREIRISNEKTYAKSTIVADVLLHARGRVSDGARPYLLHLVLSKDGKNWHRRLSTYTVPGDGVPQKAELEDWTVVVEGEAATDIVLTPAIARGVMTDPPLSARLTTAIAQVRDIRSDKTQPPALEIALTLGPLKYNIARARLDLPATLRQDNKQPLGAALRSGDWSFELASSSGLTPRDLVRHDLFLFGLDGQPLFKEIMRRGYKSSEKLTVGMKDGAGYVRVGKSSVAFPMAQQTLMTFMRDTYVGMVLAAQAGLLDNR